ncbi:hypothetical protein [Hydrogenophaga sp.]|jgi:hypothetical protein|uniref:hypothetical protein n=1 Tax=Hydrogenophaga sp. TaxID=1904254 RepID=UPI003F6E62CB
MNQGWIGAWSPGIGDPTVGGWITVALYVCTAWACLRVLLYKRHKQVVLRDNEQLIWRLLMLAMVALGINKQLDLQTALTEFARVLATEQGWYGNRRQYQEAFIAAVIVMGLTALAAMAVLVWHAPAPTLLACAGAAGLIVFVAVRAASFHHVDAILGWRWGGLPLNWILEMGSLVLISWGALRRARIPS